MRTLISLILCLFCAASLVGAQTDDGKPKDNPKDPAKKVDGERLPGGQVVDVITVGPDGFGGGVARERKLVKQFDKDRDGRLNSEERQAAREFLKKDRASQPRGGFGRGPRSFMANSLTKPVLDAADKDKDGKLSNAELTAGAKAFFSACDKEKTGTTDEAQIAAVLKELLPAPLARPDGPPGDAPRPIPGPGAARPAGISASPIVRRADENKDGKVTLAELTTAAETLFKEIDLDKDGNLNETELGVAAPLLSTGQGMFVTMGGPGMEREPGKPGPRVTPADVKNYPNATLYEPGVLRTLFLEFESKDWETELAEFKNTDVEVPATLTVDGKTYPNVGVHFRGMSSFGMAPAGSKRSLNLKLDFVDPKQRLYGYRTLNLLNSASDPSFLSTVIYSHIARKYIPAPNANLAKVVINGESWGIYANAQQFNNEFIAEHFKNTKGARWKVPVGGGGLDYLGDNLDEYKRRYEIKSADNEKSWKALIELCRVLSKTPLDQLEEALKPILNIDEVLWFLALDVALINNDGYWTRASDYCIFLDEKGKFHLIPHDMNETFQSAMSFMMMPGGRRPGGRPGGPPADQPGGALPQARLPGGQAMPPRGPGLELDPLVALDDPSKPLRSRLLAVPSLRTRYLQNVRTIATDWLDWKNLGPVVEQYRTLVEKEVEIDTRKLASTAAFKRAVSDSTEAQPETPGRRPSQSLRTFADQRRKYLLNHPEIKKLAQPD